MNFKASCREAFALLCVILMSSSAFSATDVTGVELNKNYIRVRYLNDLSYFFKLSGDNELTLLEINGIQETIRKTAHTIYVANTLQGINTITESKITLLNGCKIKFKKRDDGDDDALVSFTIDRIRPVPHEFAKAKKASTLIQEDGYLKFTDGPNRKINVLYLHRKDNFFMSQSSHYLSGEGNKWKVGAVYRFEYENVKYWIRIDKTHGPEGYTLLAVHKNVILPGLDGNGDGDGEGSSDSDSDGGGGGDSLLASSPDGGDGGRLSGTSIDGIVGGLVLFGAVGVLFAFRSAPKQEPPKIKKEAKKSSFTTKSAKVPNKELSLKKHQGKPH